MRIFTREGQAFVLVAKDTLLCIGSQEFIEKSDPKKLVDIVSHALGIAEFNTLNHRTAVRH